MLTPEQEDELKYAREGPVELNGEIWYPIAGYRDPRFSWVGSYGVYFVNDDHTDYATHGIKYRNLVSLLLKRINSINEKIYKRPSNVTTIFNPDNY